MGSRIDITGLKFGNVEVIYCVYRDRSSPHKDKWLCRCLCGCGMIRTVQRKRFSVQPRKPLNCLSLGLAHSITIGDRRGWLTVVKELKTQRENKLKWLCRCDCGKVCKKSTVQLRDSLSIVKRRALTCGCGRETGGLLTNSGLRLADISIDERKEFVHTCKLMTKIRGTQRM